MVIERQGWLRCRALCLSVYVALLLVTVSCRRASVEWTPDEYFHDAKVVELCSAIRDGDMEQFKRAIDGGADVNARGKGEMTTLLWALRYENKEMFSMLLERGADPNVVFSDAFEVLGDKALSVLHLSSELPDEFYFTEVLKHGGNANLLATRYHVPPLCYVSMSVPGRVARVQLLIDHGADVELRGLELPLHHAIFQGAFDVALLLLKNGADPMAFRDNDWRTAMHLALREKETRMLIWTADEEKAFHELVAYLDDKGCTREEAEADLRRWEERMRGTPEGFRERTKHQRERILRRKASREKANE